MSRPKRTHNVVRGIIRNLEAVAPQQPPCKGCEGTGGAPWQDTPWS